MIRFLSGASFGFTKSSKCGLFTAPIGILSVLPETLRPGAKPPNCRTLEFKRIIVIAANSFHSLRRKQFGFLFPTTCSIIVRSKPCLLSVAPKLWWRPGIIVREIILREVQNSRKTSTVNLESSSSAAIPGAPTAAAQFGIHFLVPLPMFVFLCPHKHDYREARESILNSKGSCQVPIVREIHFYQITERKYSQLGFSTLSNIRSCLKSPFFTIHRNRIGLSLKSFFGIFP